MLCSAAAGKSHSKAQSLTYDGTLQKYIVAEISHLTGNNFIWKFFNPLVYRPFGVVSHTGHFTENSVADLLDPGLYSSHVMYPHLSIFCQTTLYAVKKAIASLFLHTIALYR